MSDSVYLVFEYFQKSEQNYELSRQRNAAGHALLTYPRTFKPVLKKVGIP